MTNTVQNLMQGSDTLAKLRALQCLAVPASIATARDSACKALAAVAMFHRRSRDLVLETEARSRVGLRPTMKQIADQVGGGGYADRDRVVRNVQERRMNEERAKWSREVAGKSSDTIAKLATDARDAFAAFDLALEGERLRWHGPSSLRDDAPKSLEQHLAEQRLAAELEAAGVDHIEQVYAGTLKIGDVARAERIEAASRRYLLRVIDENGREEERRKRARSGRSGPHDTEAMSKAVALLATFERERANRIPQELRNAEALRDALDQVFADLLGMSAKHLSTEAFASRFLQGGPREHNPYEVDPRWPMRFSPPNAPLDPEAAPPGPMRMTRP